MTKNIKTGRSFVTAARPGLGEPRRLQLPDGVPDGRPRNAELPRHIGLVVLDAGRMTAVHDLLCEELGDVLGPRRRALVEA